MPLDPSGHAAAWEGRSPSDEKVRDFARRIETSAPRSVSFDPSDGLTLAEGEIVALVYNHDLRVARLKAGVAKATAEHAGRWDDPELSFDVLKVTEGVPNPWVVGSALSVTLPISGRLAVEKARADAAEQSELARVAEEEWETLRDLRKAWLEWSADRLRLQETESIVGSLDSAVETTGKLTEAGELPRTESTLFKLEQESRKADIARLRGKVKEGEQEIRSLMGISPGAPAKLVPTLASGSGKDRGKLADTNPTLIRLQGEYAEAELVLVREIRKQFPDLQLGPAFEEDQGQSKIGITGGIPIPILNSNKGGIATAKAQREVARAAFETELERTEGRLASMRARLSGAQSRRQSIDSNVVPLVDRQVEDARSLLEIGEGGSLVLLESLVRAYEAKLDLIEARLEESVAGNDIRHLLGPDRLTAKTK
ncbi:efflux transporter [Haloferula helveola]|uniref:Efflux transporter n=1 Tax=Haloferula helveola TaxID=490095 RepID=A0ABM7RMR8_9BACT|nr:efflux transporter [Haloferula helveola]